MIKSCITRSTNFCRREVGANLRQRFISLGLGRIHNGSTILLSRRIYFRSSTRLWHLPLVIMSSKGETQPIASSISDQNWEVCCSKGICSLCRITGNQKTISAPRSREYLRAFYRRGDRICLFGFSRGAYVVRVLMGMIYKVSGAPVPHFLLMMENQVGLLPPNNIEQVNLAYTMYEATDEKGYRLSQRFKKTYSYVYYLLLYLGSNLALSFRFQDPCDYRICGCLVWIWSWIYSISWHNIYW